MESLPKDYRYAVDVRYPHFTTRDIEEQDFNQSLRSLDVDRVILETRALFLPASPDQETVDAQRRKPNLPVKKVATSNNPFTRFVAHPNSEMTAKFLQDWVDPIMQWLDGGLQPYFFTHMPDDLHVPRLGRRFVEMLIEAGLNVTLPDWPRELEKPAVTQIDLFNS